jgi:TP901 family phage tail tape measure protein
VRKGKGSLDGFVASMSSIAGLSANVGVGFDELGSAMGYITAKGQTELAAATQLKVAMTTLLNPNKELSEALQAVGLSSGSAMLKEYGLAESLNIVKQG